jgi:alpha-N-arabinofuranosidase
MVLTPTYHVFEMYKVHQDATLLPLTLDAEAIEEGGASLPALSASASRDAEGRTHLSLCNLRVEKDAELEIEVRGLASALAGATGRVLTAPRMDARNDFGEPGAVVPKAFEGAKVEGGKLKLRLPPMSVAVLELR